jgi:Co/Zn/Cd efflux system component
VFVIVEAVRRLVHPPEVASAVTGFERADPIASLAIGVVIIPRTWQLLRQATEVLLEATPKNVDLDDHQRRERAVSACGRDRRRGLRPGARPARRLPGRSFRHRALHLPDRATRPP